VVVTLNLTKERAAVFRVTHIDNLRWILRNGLCCVSSGNLDPDFIAIGNPDIISKRFHRRVPVPPEGSLDDYVPFYFTPCSMMLLNVVTGYGVPQRNKDEIVILVSSIPNLQSKGVAFVFTDKHALVAYARFFNEVARLDEVDWALLNARDFARSDADPGKGDRYQAEVLAHQYVPTTALLGIACYSETSRARVVSMLQEAEIDLQVIVKREWFFG
jgi:hypothetical protein